MIEASVEIFDFSFTYSFNSINYCNVNKTKMKNSCIY